MLPKIQMKGAIDSKAIGTYEIGIDDFLRLTSTKDLYKSLIATDPKVVDNHTVAPFVDFNAKTGDVEGHEGRHRAATALHSGDKKITIALYPSPKRREWKEDLSEMPKVLKGQFDPSVRVKLDAKKIKIIKQNIKGYDPNNGNKYEGVIMNKVTKILAMSEAKEMVKVSTEMEDESGLVTVELMQDGKVFSNFEFEIGKDEGNKDFSMYDANDDKTYSVKDGKSAAATALNKIEGLKLDIAEIGLKDKEFITKFAKEVDKVIKEIK